MDLYCRSAPRLFFPLLILSHPPPELPVVVLQGHLQAVGRETALHIEALPVSRLAIHAAQQVFVLHLCRKRLSASFSNVFEPCKEEVIL